MIEQTKATPLPGLKWCIHEQCVVGDKVDVDWVEHSPTTPVVPSPISSSCDFDTYSHNMNTLNDAGEAETHLDEQLRYLMFDLHLAENGGSIIGDGDITIRGNEDFVEA